MRTTINISLPESLRLYIAKRAEESGCTSLSEYVRDLVRDDQKRHLEKVDERTDRLHRHAEFRRRGY
jgi:antitoxin ParD1/3/4